MNAALSFKYRDVIFCTTTSHVFLYLCLALCTADWLLRTGLDPTYSGGLSLILFLNKKISLGGFGRKLKCCLTIPLQLSTHSNISPFYYFTYCGKHTGLNSISYSAFCFLLQLPKLLFIKKKKSGERTMWQFIDLEFLKWQRFICKGILCFSVK